MYSLFSSSKEKIYMEEQGDIGLTKDVALERRQDEEREAQSETERTEKKSRKRNAESDVQVAANRRSGKPGSLC